MHSTVEFSIMSHSRPTMNRDDNSEISILYAMTLLEPKYFNYSYIMKICHCWNEKLKYPQFLAK